MGNAGFISSTILSIIPTPIAGLELLPSYRELGPESRATFELTALGGLGLSNTRTGLDNRALGYIML